MKLTVLCLFATLTAGAQSTTEHLPVTDAEKIADALRAAPNFITDGATIADLSDMFTTEPNLAPYTSLPSHPRVFYSARARIARPKSQRRGRLDRHRR
jgi:hypothetical protein